MSTILTHNLLLQNIVTGTQPTTWWNTSNNDRTLMDAAIAGVANYTITGDMTITAAVANGSARVWQFNGSLTVPAHVTYSPNTSQNWVFVVNNSGQPLTLSQGTGTTLMVDDDISAIVMFDGAGAGANCTQFSFNNSYLPGTVAAPGITFLGYPDVGLYAYGGFPSITTGLGIASNGVEMVAFTSQVLGPMLTVYGLNAWGQFQ